MTISERIRFLRKEKLGITQEALGEPLGLTRANIANIEAGRVAVTERVIISVCEKFNVNEDWLRTGTGEMFVQRTRNQIITDFLGDLIIEEASFKKRLIEALAELDERDWEGLERLAKKLINKMD
ncbi:helix-turn-helix domain-containing protein [Enterocloster lavalensis]|uniref:helix-turn-helix domain-containing protein n=1 Tax=Enterocloster lavalensis TaxID=460384 RepID=UPI001FA92F36|nr:helix-turn-helix transcriptional regulator [Enterocloster lavalensis]